MPILRGFCWALLFLLRLRFPPGTSVARINIITVAVILVIVSVIVV